MTPRQIDLIRASWSAVEPIADTAATLFYDQLFELDPAIRRLFRRTDMAAQRKILMQTLTVVVKSLDKLDTIVPAVQALGRRHAATAFAASTTSRSGSRSCGPSSWDSVTRSTTRPARRGQRPMGRSRR